MHGEPLYDYFGVGARLIYLRHAQQRLPTHGQGYILNVIELFLKDIEKFPLPTTSAAAENLREFYQKIKGNSNDYVLSKNEAKELSNIADQLTPIFEAETKHILTVVLIQKRFEIGRLMSNVSGLMSGETYSMLPDVAKYDMDEAGKCIALDRPTAAAFHTLRATEAMLKKMYLHFIKRNRLVRPMWNDMVFALRNRKGKKPDNSLIEHLDMIRRNYRNPTQHPEKIYDIEEAQDLFANCISAQNMMVKAVSQ